MQSSGKAANKDKILKVSEVALCCPKEGIVSSLFFHNEFVAFIFSNILSALINFLQGATKIYPEIGREISMRICFDIVEK